MKLKCLAMALLVAAMSLAAYGAEGEKAPGGEGHRRGPGGPGGPGDRPGPMMMTGHLRHAIGELGLSDDQKAKIEGIIQGTEATIKKIMEDAKGSGDRKQAMEGVKAAMEKLREDVGAVLTPEQKEKLQKAIAGGMRGGPGMMVDRLKEGLAKLDLTAEQKEEVAGILKVAREKLEALHKDAAGGQEKDGMREKFKAIFDEAREQLKAVLTPEQAEKLKAMREEHRGPGENRGEKRGEKPAEK